MKNKTENENKMYDNRNLKILWHTYQARPKIHFQKSNKTIKLQ